MKKIIALFTSVCLILTFFPAPSIFAVESGEESAAEGAAGESESSAISEEFSDEETFETGESSDFETGESSWNTTADSAEETAGETNEQASESEQALEPEQQAEPDQTAEPEQQAEPEQEQPELEPESEESEESEQASEPGQESEGIPDERTQEILDRLQGRLDELAAKPQTISQNPEIEFQKEMEAFPESYREALTAIHAKYPDWKFEAVNTGLDWYEAVRQESSYNRALIPVSSDHLLLSNASGDYNAARKTYIAKDGTSWVSASRSAVAYFMDPRNFLDEKHIFMFEANSYNEKTHTLSQVESILDGTFMSSQTNPTISYLDAEGNRVNTEYTYADVIWDAAVTSKVSTLYIATKIRLEIGVSGTSGSVSGNYGSYPGIYNYYNIGAYSSADPVSNGLRWASTVGSYDRPWTSPMLSINGGAVYIGEQYIVKGQDTGYYMRFNVNPNHYYALYSHQYMTSIAGAASEAQTTYAAANKNVSRVFYIPVYKNMPDKTASVAFNKDVKTGVTLQSVNVRDRASLSSVTQTTLKAGTEVTILDGVIDASPYQYSFLSNPYWYKVQYTLNGKTCTGYIHEGFLRVKAEKSISAAKTAKLTLATGDASMLYFETGDPGVATVGADGTVTGVNAGTTTIYVVSGGGKFDAMQVNVTGGSSSQPTETPSEKPTEKPETPSEKPETPSEKPTDKPSEDSPAKDISSSDITVSPIKEQVYTGAAIQPNVKIADKGTVLAEGTDYSLTYVSNINIGTATVIITGEGKYTGSRTVNFEIVKQAASSTGGGSGETTSYYRTTENLKFRTGPGLSFEIAGVIPKGTRVAVVDGESKKADGYIWFAVKQGDRHYYVASNWLKKIESSGSQSPSTPSGGESFDTYMTTERLNYRTGPGITNAIAGTLAVGAKVQAVKDYASNADGYTWFKIKINGTYYYAVSNWLKKVDSSDNSGSSPSDSGSGSSGSGSGSSGSDSGSSGNGSDSSDSGSSGGGSSNGESIVTYTTTDRLNYRTGPGPSYPVVATLPVGTSVQVVNGYAKKADGYIWFMIQVNGRQYYTASNWLKKSASSGGSSGSSASSGNTSSSSSGAESVTEYTTTARLNYRTGPGLSYAIAGTFAVGTKIQTVNGYAKKADNYIWYKVRYNNKEYYVASSWLKK